jgi:hypothetical protein
MPAGGGPTVLSFASDNYVVDKHFQGVRLLVANAHRTLEEAHLRIFVMLSVIAAVTAVEVFVNVFFRRLVEDTSFFKGAKEAADAKQLVLADLQNGEGIDHKLRHWPPKVLGKPLKWQKGVAHQFNALREMRNDLVHFRAFHESHPLLDVMAAPVVDPSPFNDLELVNADEALALAEAMIREIQRLRGTPEEELDHALHYWSGRPPQG